MKNIISKVKEKDNIAVFILFFLISLGISLNLYIEASDELWNFQNVYKMYNGFKIYEEINVIITPLFFWCTEILFSILGANLFVFRICHSFLMGILFLYTYKILKKLKIPKVLSILIILLMAAQEFFLIIRTSFNYNNMALLFFIMGVYYLLNEKTRPKISIQAIITILIILTKQNMGIYYLIGNILYLSIQSKTIKEKIKDNIKYLAIVLLGMVFFLIYLILNHNLYNFINYALGGLGEFANENLNFDISSIIFLLGISITNTCVNIKLLQKNVFSTKQKENIKILWVFSLMLSFICYPIFNMAHIVMGTYLTIINIIYVIFTLFADFKYKMQKVIKIITAGAILCSVIFSIYNLYKWTNIMTSHTYPYTWDHPFFGGVIGKNDYEKNEKVIAYIEENNKDVIVLSNRAALYMIPLKRNNGDFDLPFKGNLGIKGEDGLIEKIEEKENVQYLIFKEENESIYQETTKVKDYIKNNKNYVGEIEGFEIYE